MKQPAVYILASARNGTLYVGVTSDLVKGVAQHRGGEFWRFCEEVRCAQAGALRAVCRYGLGDREGEGH